MVRIIVWRSAADIPEAALTSSAVGPGIWVVGADGVEGGAAADGGTGAAGAGSLDGLRAQLLAQKVVRCDEIAWSLAGISMAGYNMAAALGLSTFAGLAAFRMAIPGARNGGDDG